METTATFTVTVKSEGLTNYELQGLMKTLFEEMNTICEDTACMLNTDLVISVEKGE